MWLTKECLSGDVKQTESDLQLLAELGDAGNIRAIEFARHSELLVQGDCLPVQSILGTKMGLHVEFVRYECPSPPPSLHPMSQSE